MTEQQYEQAMEQILKQIPNAFHTFIKFYAWSGGHAYGYEEVLEIATDLTQELVLTLDSYTYRLRRNFGSSN